MTSLFDDITQFDEGFLANRREAAAVAHKRVQDRVGSYLKVAKTPTEYGARLSFVYDDVRQIVAEVAEEFSVDHDKLAEAIDESLKGEGVTDINEELEDAPSAVGEKTAGGHKDGCTCGFCKNKGNLPGRVDQKEQEDKDASEPEDDDDSGVVDKESSTKTASEFGHLPLHRNEEGHVLATPSNMAVIEEELARTSGDNPYGSAPIVAHSPNTGEQYSASSGDYFAGNPHEPLMDEGGSPMILGRPYSGIEPVASIKVADASRDGGGAVKREKLPKGDGKSVGTGPSPKIDRKTWKPNALNADGNLPPVDSEMKGSPVPTQTQDLVDEKPDYEGDFLRDTDAVTTQQDLPSADDTGHSTERNISQEGQSGTWTEGQNDAVTSEVFASIDPDVNPLKAILESGFATDNQVESAIREFESE